MLDATIFAVTAAFLSLGGILVLYYVCSRYCKMFKTSRSWLPSLLCTSRQFDDRLPLYEEVVQFSEESPLKQKSPSYEEAVRIMKDTSKKLSNLQQQLTSSVQSWLDSHPHQSHKNPNARSVPNPHQNRENLNSDQIPILTKPTKILIQDVTTKQYFEGKSASHK